MTLTLASTLKRTAVGGQLARPTELREVAK